MSKELHELVLDQLPYVNGLDCVQLQGYVMFTDGYSVLTQYSNMAWIDRCCVPEEEIPAVANRIASEIRDALLTKYATDELGATVTPVPFRFMPRKR